MRPYPGTRNVTKRSSDLGKCLGVYRAKEYHRYVEVHRNDPTNTGYFLLALMSQGGKVGVDRQSKECTWHMHRRSLMLRKIVSGGQTGVDRAALDVALERGLEVGGWCPRGRVAEDGGIPDRYPLRETPGRAYEQRTEWNVRDSDATIILVRHDITSPGTQLTEREAVRYGRPFVRLDPTAPDAASAGAAWVCANNTQVLNVAGPRESECSGIYASASAFIRRMLDVLESE